MSIRRLDPDGGGLCSLPHILCVAGDQRCGRGGLQFAMQDIAGRFQKETGKTVKPIYGSSGNFLQQIQERRTLRDFFFPRTSINPKKLEAAGLTEPGSYYQYARGKIVVWNSERFEARF